MNIELELSTLVNSLVLQRDALRLQHAEDQATIERVTEELKEMRIMYEAEILRLRGRPRFAQ